MRLIWDLFNELKLKPKFEYEYVNILINWPQNHNSNFSKCQRRANK